MPSSAAVPAVPDRQAQLRTFNELLPRFLRLLQVYRAMLTRENRDRAAYVLLFALDRLGPQRQSALADRVHADPSTVSRHVTTLVERGLVERVPDETDRRASQLLITPAGVDTLARLRAEGEAHLAQVTASWDDAEVATLTALFGRLVEDLAAFLPGEILDEQR